MRVKAMLFVTKGCKVGMFQKASKQGVGMWNSAVYAVQAQVDFARLRLCNVVYVPAMRYIDLFGVYWGLATIHCWLDWLSGRMASSFHM